MTEIFTALMLMIPTTHHTDPRWKVVKPYDEKLDRIAHCESTGRWSLDTGNGFYGGLQFKLSTWKSVGGRGYPNKNSKLEQKFRAVILIHLQGYNPWPNCGSA